MSEYKYRGSTIFIRGKTYKRGSRKILITSKAETIVLVSALFASLPREVFHWGQKHTIYRVVQKKLWCDLEEKCLRNYKIFFDGVFLSIYSHLLKKLQLSKLYWKKLWALKIWKMACSIKVTLSKMRYIFLFFFYFCCKIIVIPI